MDKYKQAIINKGGEAVAEEFFGLMAEKFKVSFLGGFQKFLFNFFILILGLSVIALIGWRPYKIVTDPAYAAEYSRSMEKQRMDRRRESAAAIKQAQAEQEKERLAETPYVDKKLSGFFSLADIGSREALRYSSRAEGSFFLVAGNYSGKAEGAALYNVRFSWEVREGVFINSELPFTEIRQELDFDAKNPSIKFVWKEHPKRVGRLDKGCWYPDKKDNENWLLANCLKYAVIKCSPDDWSRRTKLSLQ